MTRGKRAGAPVAAGSRALSFSSQEEMERFDREVVAILAQYDEDRHRCEVRAILSITSARGNWEPAVKYLEVVRKKRGDAGADRLAADVKAQWKLGNRGDKGDWREG